MVGMSNILSLVQQIYLKISKNEINTNYSSNQAPSGKSPCIQISYMIVTHGEVTIILWTSFTLLIATFFQALLYATLLCRCL